MVPLLKSVKIIIRQGLRLDMFIFLHRKHVIYFTLGLFNKRKTCITIKDTLKVFEDFKTSSKIVWSNIFWYVKVFIFWKFIQYTIPSDKVNSTKNTLFFFRELQLVTVLLLIRNSYMSWSTRFISLKVCVGFRFSIPFLFY